eukprot:3678710-Pyramimonas_sp.AAC.2
MAGHTINMDGSDVGLFEQIDDVGPFLSEQHEAALQFAGDVPTRASSAAPAATGSSSTSASSFDFYWLRVPCEGCPPPSV